MIECLCEELGECLWLDFYWLYLYLFDGWTKFF